MINGFQLLLSNSTCAATPRRGPDHERDGVRLTLEELRDEKRAEPLRRQAPKAVLPPLAAIGGAAGEPAHYALSNVQYALAVPKVSNFRQLRRAFVGDFLSTSTYVVGGPLGAGAGQGLALVHFSAQPEPFLTQNTPSPPPGAP